MDTSIDDEPRTGASGEGQQATPQSEVLPRLTHQLPRTMAETVSALAGARPRGTDAAFLLASAYMSETHNNFEDLKQQLRVARGRVDDLQEKLESARIDNAGLRAAGIAQRRLDNIFKGLGIAGGLLCGVGTDLFKGGGDNAPLGIIMVVVGIVAVISSCYSFVGGASK